MSSPYSEQSTSGPDWLDTEAARNASGGRDIIDWMQSIERRLERLEAQLNTH